MFSENELNEFLDNYLESLVWSSDDGSDEYREAIASDALKARADVECRAFLYRFACFINAEPTAPGMAQAGHDFALTRNGHGAGFWDGEWPLYGELLSKGAEAFGSIDLYIGDDGGIYGA